MIVCPNCNHHNPEGATQCEACYTPLPEMMPCPNCGAPVQVDANFCGQCGFSIQSPGGDLPTALEASGGQPQGDDDLAAALASANSPDPNLSSSGQPPSNPAGAISGNADVGERELNSTEIGEALEPTAMVPGRVGTQANVPPTVQSSNPTGNQPNVGAPPLKSTAATQLQSNQAILLHLRTNVEMGLPDNLSVIHIGKPNDRVPPDIDVSGFPDSEVVSRVHADIRVEGDAYYIEDLGSSNGTYINNLPLAPGNRHRLRMGDRIALGKGDLVTFLFQVA